VQTIRQPVYGVLILATFGVLVMDVPLSGWTMDVSGEHRASDQKMLHDLGVSTLLMSGLLIAAFAASNALRIEVEDKTVLTVISKPVSRATFVLGKFVGVAAAVVVAFYLCSVAFLITVRHGVMSTASDPYDWPAIVLGLAGLGAALLTALLGNLLFGWSFAAAGIVAGLVLLTAAGGMIGFIGKGWTIVPFGHEISPQLPASMALSFLGVLVFSAVALAASTRLSQVMTLLVCCAVLLAGYVHPFLFGPESRQLAILRPLGWIVPNLRYFDAQESLMREKAIPLDYIGLAAAYGVLYVAAALAVAVALFQRRALEPSTASSIIPGAVSLLAWVGRTAALLIGGGVVVAVLSSPTALSLGGLSIAGAAVLAAAAAWVVWTFFAMGAKWAYWLLLVFFLAAATMGAAGLFGLRWAQRGPFSHSIGWTVATTAGACFVILVLLLPRTRHHFRSSI
jgi:ABC-type transport system involved in multi-copper enzyme maturation permease subunit